MRILFLEINEEKYKSHRIRQAQWHKYFCWVPTAIESSNGPQQYVLLGDNHCPVVWLELIERRITWVPGDSPADGTGDFLYEYRRLQVAA